MIFNKVDNVKLAYAVGRKTDEDDGTDQGSTGELIGMIRKWRGKFVDFLLLTFETDLKNNFLLTFFITIRFEKGFVLIQE